MYKVERRPVSQTPAASTQAAVQQAANCNAVKISALRCCRPEKAGSEWELADAILAECSETGKDGDRNDSYAKMEAMREEIAKTAACDLSFERIRKLRKVASAFPPGRRRPAVSLEGHLEAGTPEALDAFINSAPNGTPLTCAYIRQLKHPTERVEQDQQKAERRHQIEDQRTALQNLCRQQERKTEKLVREKEERERQYTALCRSIGKEPEPFSPPLSPDNEPPLSVAEDLERALRFLLMARGFDPAALKKAIADFVGSSLGAGAMTARLTRQRRSNGAAGALWAEAVASPAGRHPLRHQSAPNQSRCDVRRRYGTR